MAWDEAIHGRCTIYTHHSAFHFNHSGNKLTSDDLGCVFEEVLDMSPQWYNLGLQLKVKTGTLDRIYAQFRGDPRDQLRETLKTWLTTSDNPIWRTLTDALKSQSVGATQLAGDLETKYCPVEGTDVSRGKVCLQHA